MFHVQSWGKSFQDKNYLKNTYYNFLYYFGQFSKAKKYSTLDRTQFQNFYINHKLREVN